MSCWHGGVVQSLRPGAATLQVSLLLARSGLLGAPTSMGSACRSLNFPCLCRLASASFLPLPQRLESKWLAKTMLGYIGRHHEAFTALFDMMVVFSSPMSAPLRVACVALVSCCRECMRPRHVRPYVPCPHGVCGLLSCSR